MDMRDRAVLDSLRSTNEAADAARKRKDELQLEEGKKLLEKAVRENPELLKDRVRIPKDDAS